MVVLSLFTLLLSRLSGQEDIIVGTPVAARHHPDLENIVGMFVNTLPMRNYPHPGKNFIDYFAGVKKRALEAFENQEYPFEDIVERVWVEREEMYTVNGLLDIFLKEGCQGLEWSLSRLT